VAGAAAASLQNMIELGIAGNGEGRNYMKNDKSDLKSHGSKASGSLLKTQLASIGGALAAKGGQYALMKKLKNEKKMIGLSGLSKDVKAGLDSFIESHDLKDLKVNATIFGKPLSDYYNPLKHSINLKTDDIAIALHEAGHAADIRGSLLKTVGRRLPLGLTGISVPTALIYGDYIKKKIPGSIDDKVIDFIQKNPTLLALGAYALATLHPEAKASLTAYKHMKKTLGESVAKAHMTKTLLPAFGTYALGSVPIIAATQTGKALLEKKTENQMKKKANLKPDQKAFLAGFIGAAIPAGSYVGYKAFGSGGKHLIDVEDETDRYDSKLPGNGNLKYKINKKLNEVIEKYPLTSTVTTSMGVGSLAGLVSVLMMKGMDLKRRTLKT